MNDVLQENLGYYVVDNVKYVSKIAACVKATQMNKPVTWVFNDQFLNAVDWTKEPEESLQTLYLKRAREIREKYDYVVISYSGGADSTNIVRTFLDNNLFIDEILVNTFERAQGSTVDHNMNNTSAENYSAEHKLQIYPRLEEIRLRSPLTKINITDLSGFLFKSSLTKDTPPEWVLTQREVLNPSGITRFNYIDNTQVRKRFDKTLSACVIVGIEKPITYIKPNTNEYRLMFADGAVNLTPVDTHFTEYDNTSVEYFYWHPTTMRLIAKQAHVVKRWLEANPQYHDVFTFTSGRAFRESLTIRHALLRTVLYDNWNPKWFQTSKGRIDWFCSLDAWFHKLYENTEHARAWYRGIEYVRKNAAPYLEGHGLKPFIKDFYVGELKTTTPNLINV